MARQNIGIILVVGALCAILAVIFFPVFVQSKEAAKETSTVARYKERALEAEMKLADATGGAPLHEASRQPGAERSNIRQATLAVDVVNLQKAETQMRETVAGAGGYIDHLEGEDLAGDQPTMRLTIRVPERSFDGIVANFEGLGHRTQKSLSSSDLTEQILESEAQIQEARRHVQEGSGTADQVKTLQAQKNDLMAKAVMSTIDLTLQQKPNADLAAAANVNWGNDTWNAAVTSAMGAFRVIGAIAIWLLVYSPIWGAIAVACLFGMKLRKRHLGGPQAA